MGRKEERKKKEMLVIEVYEYINILIVIKYTILLHIK
jgi:hypothetical protein